jgi:hypothetical protein
MSKTTMYAFPTSGPRKVFKEFFNAWGSAFRVWKALATKYLGNGFGWMLNGSEAQKLWDLSTDVRLSPTERIVLLSTFDYALVNVDKMASVSTAFRDFVRMYPTKNVCHLTSFADALDEIREGRHGLEIDVIAVGWQQTSVNENPWWVREGEEEGRSYDMSKDNKHFFVGVEGDV